MPKLGAMAAAVYRQPEAMNTGFRAWRDATAARLNAASVVAQTPRGPVEYAVAGTGPAVLVIHGRPGGYDQGLVIARSLNEARFRFVAVSRPGYLRTPLETGRTPEDQADVLAALLDVLGVPQAAVIALSAGGPAALQFALRHPSRCWGLVLISARTQRLVRAPAAPRIAHAVLGASDAVGWMLSRVLACLPEQIAGRKALLLEGVQTFVPYSLRRAGAANDLLQLTRLPGYPLSEVTVPTLVIHGAADRIASPSNADVAARAIPEAQAITITGGGHGVFFTHHDRLAPRILEFLTALTESQQDAG